MNILFVVSSTTNDPTSGRKLGTWLDGLAPVYYEFADKGGQITFASPQGGATPVLTCASNPLQQACIKRFLADCDARSALADALPLTQVYWGDFDGFYYPGGDGLLWDLWGNPNSQQLIQYAIHNGRPLGLLGWAPVLLAHAQDYLGRPFLVHNPVSLLHESEVPAEVDPSTLPIQPEAELLGRGGRILRIASGHTQVVRTQTVVTAQNAASGQLLAKKMRGLARSHPLSK